MPIGIEGATLLFVQYGDSSNTELRAVYQYDRDAERLFHNARLEDYVNGKDMAVRLIMVDTQAGECRTKLLEAE